MSSLFKYGKCYFRDEIKLFQQSICARVSGGNFMTFFNIVREKCHSLKENLSSTPKKCHASLKATQWEN